MNADRAAILQRIMEAAREIIEREHAELLDIKDHSCFAAGWCHGSISAAKEILDCLSEGGTEEC